MWDRPLVFVDVDTQRDFIEPDGALAIPGAGSIRRNLARLSEFARDRGLLVLATACAHTPDDPDPDPEPFPAHCLVGTVGQTRIPETIRPGSVVIGPDSAFEGPIAGHLTIEKRHYDLFRNPNADRVVASLRSDDPTFVVFGVATDYCVRAAVLGLLQRGCKVAVVVDAIRAVEPHREPEVLEEFVRLGAVLAMTGAICG